MMIAVYGIDPVPAPRQVGRDAWNPTPHVLRYRAYRDWLQLMRAICPIPFHHIIFALRMPDGWSGNKRAAHAGRPHMQRPDRDNLEKAYLDSVLAEDCTIWNGHTTKLWAERGMIIVSADPLMVTLPFNFAPCYAALAASRGQDMAMIEPQALLPI